MDRRLFVGGGIALLPLGEVLAQGARAGFEAQGFQQTLAALGLAAPQPSRDLVLDAPDIAENGAAVSLSLSSKLTTVKRFYLLAEKNPTSLLAWYEISDAMEPRLSTQIKLAQSSLVYGVAQLADGKLLLAQKDVKVTLGGCAA